MKATQDVFLVRGVNHQQIVEDYLDGKYDNLDLPIEKPILKKKTGAHTHVQKSAVGKNHLDPIYERVTSNGNYRVYTTNSARCRSYLAEIAETSPNKHQEPSPDGRVEFCDHCRVTITGDILVVPIYHKKYGDVTVLSGEYIVGHYCCARAIIRQKKREDPLSSLYKDSEQILNHIARKLDIPISSNSAPDWKLLEDNGGSMPRAEYYNGETVFRSHPSVICLPVKSQWETKIEN